jgi:hypothetical protein
VSVSTLFHAIVIERYDNVSLLGQFAMAIYLHVREAALETASASFPIIYVSLWAQVLDSFASVPHFDETVRENRFTNLPSISPILQKTPDKLAKQYHEKDVPLLCDDPRNSTIEDTMV